MNIGIFANQLSFFIYLLLENEEKLQNTVYIFDETFKYEIVKKVIFPKCTTASRADRKSMNRSVKNRPEMIPKPNKNRDMPLPPIRNTPRPQSRAYRAKNPRK